MNIFQWIIIKLCNNKVRVLFHCLPHTQLRSTPSAQTRYNLGNSPQKCPPLYVKTQSQTMGELKIQHLLETIEFVIHFSSVCMYRKLNKWNILKYGLHFRLKPYSFINIQRHWFCYWFVQCIVKMLAGQENYQNLYLYGLSKVK